MSTQVIPPTSNALQAWSNAPEDARANLRTIFSGLNADESISEWACEALDHCGPPLDRDLDFLAQSTTNYASPAAYWACKLIGRLGSKANSLQGALASVMTSDQADQATRQQAALALGMIGSLTATSRDSLQLAAKSTDPRLARLSSQALGGNS